MRNILAIFTIIYLLNYIIEFGLQFMVLIEMNYRIARKILTCKSTLHTNPIAVHRAKKHLIEIHRGNYIESPSGNTYFILK